MRALILVFCLLAASACDEKSPTGPTVTLNERFTLAAGQVAVVEAIGDRSVQLGIWLMCLPGLLFGTLNVLAPLRMDALGAGAGPEPLDRIGFMWRMGRLYRRLARGRGAQATLRPQSPNQFPLSTVVPLAVIDFS